MSKVASESSSTAYDNLRILRRRPVCIICAKPSEAETLAHFLLAQSWVIPGTEVAEVNDSHKFWLGNLRLRHGELKFYITSCQRQGIQSFGIETSFLFSILRPVCAIHAGVCAAMTSRGISIGDVVFGDAAVSYEEGKWTFDENENPKFLPDYETIILPSGDMQAYVSMGRESPYKDVHGVYVSGSAVREDAAGIFTRMHDNVSRNVIALEMEGSAFLKLCRHSGIKSLGVIKGVSDMGDTAKTKVHVAYNKALANTADAIKPWLVYSLTEAVSGDNGPEQGEELAKRYYENFLNPLLDLIFDDTVKGNTTVKNKSSGAVETVNGIKGFKIIMPESYPLKGGMKAVVLARCNLLAVLEVKQRTPWDTAFDIPGTLNSSAPMLAQTQTPYFSKELDVANIVPLKQFLEEEQNAKQSLTMLLGADERAILADFADNKKLELERENLPENDSKRAKLDADVTQFTQVMATAAREAGMDLSKKKNPFQ